MADTDRERRATASAPLSIWRMTFTFADVIKIVGGVIALMLIWGRLEGRFTALEHGQTTLRTEVTSLKEEMRRVGDLLENPSGEQVDLWRGIKRREKPAPRGFDDPRTAPNSGR